MSGPGYLIAGIMTSSSSGQTTIYRGDGTYEYFDGRGNVTYGYYPANPPKAKSEPDRGMSLKQIVCGRPKVEQLRKK